jgi:hypothetical protein
MGSGTRDVRYGTAEVVKPPDGQQAGGRIADRCGWDAGSRRRTLVGLGAGVAAGALPMATPDVPHVRFALLLDDPSVQPTAKNPCRSENRRGHPAGPPGHRLAVHRRQHRSRAGRRPRHAHARRPVSGGRGWDGQPVTHRPRNVTINGGGGTADTIHCGVSARKRVTRRESGALLPLGRRPSRQLRRLVPRRPFPHHAGYAVYFDVHTNLLTAPGRWEEFHVRGPGRAGGDRDRWGSRAWDRNAAWASQQLDTVPERVEPSALG